MHTDTDELFLEAEKELKNDNYLEAKKLYEQVLEDSPGYAAAHNSLGWLYYSKFENLRIAENHYRAGITFDKNYPHCYWNLVDVMIDEKRWNEAVDFITNTCLHVVTLGRSQCYSKLGIIEELQHQYDKAIANYIQAIKNTCSNERIEDLKKDIARVEYKKSLDA